MMPTSSGRTRVGGVANEHLNRKGIHMSAERLIGEMESVAREAEDLIKATSGEVSDKVREARTRLTGALETARVTADRCKERAIAGAQATDKLIRENPYQTMGIALAAGLLVGVLVNRSGNGRS